MSNLSGPDILLRFNRCADEPLEFNEENFPPGSFVMGNSGKLVRVDVWTPTVSVNAGDSLDVDPEPAASVMIWDHEWYDSPGAPPETPGRVTSVRSTAFKDSAGKGWKIEFPLTKAEDDEAECKEETPATKGVKVPWGGDFEGPKQEGEGTISPLEAAEDEPPAETNEPTDEEKLAMGPLPAVEIPDEHVDGAEEPPEEKPTQTLTVAHGKSGPHPSNRSHVGRLYNHLLDNNGAMKMDDLVAWANDGKLSKKETKPEDIKALVDELCAEEWPISVEAEGTEGEYVSINGAVVGSSQPSKLDRLHAAAWRYAQELVAMGIYGVRIEMVVDDKLVMEVSAQDESGGMDE
jgi:hypothetical protein